MFPHVQLVLRELNTRQQLDALHEGELDVGFLRLPIRTLPVPISIQIVQSEPMCVALREDHPLARMKTVDLARLAGEPFIMYPYDLGGGLHDLSIALCKQAGFAPKVEQEARTVAMAVELRGRRNSAWPWSRRRSATCTRGAVPAAEGQERTHGDRRRSPEQRPLSARDGVRQAQPHVSQQQARRLILIRY